jgi:hypothetical protein
LAGCSQAPAPAIPNDLMLAAPEPVRAIQAERDVALYALDLATWGRRLAAQLDAICEIQGCKSDAR